MLKKYFKFFYDLPMRFVRRNVLSADTFCRRYMTPIRFVADTFCPPIRFVSDTFCSRFVLLVIRFGPIRFVPIRFGADAFCPDTFCSCTVIKHRDVRNWPGMAWNYCTSEKISRERDSTEDPSLTALCLAWDQFELAMRQTADHTASDSSPIFRWFVSTVNWVGEGGAMTRFLK